MLCHRWAVPPNLSTYDKHYKNPVIDVTLLNSTGLSLVSCGSAGKSKANPCLWNRNAGKLRGLFFNHNLNQETMRFHDGAWRRVEEDVGDAAE